MFRDFLTFSRTCIFFLLTFSSLLFFLLLFSSLRFSSLLCSFLLFSDSSHLCFSSVHIVGSLASKLPSIIILNDDQRCIYHFTSTYKWSLTYTVNTSLMLTYHEPLMLPCHVHIAIDVPRGRVHLSRWLAAPLPPPWPLRLWRSRASRPSGARMPRGDETSGATSVPRASDLLKLC